MAEATAAAATAVEIAEATVRNSVDAAAADVLAAVAAAGGMVVEVEAAVVDSVKAAGATCLLRSTLPRKVKIAAQNAAVIAAAVVDIRNAAAKTIVGRAVTSTAVRQTLRALPRLRMHQPKNLLCCPANRWPNIAHAQ